MFEVGVYPGIKHLDLLTTLVGSRLRGTHFDGEKDVNGKVLHSDVDTRIVYAVPIEDRVRCSSFTSRFKEDTVAFFLR